MLEKSVSKKHTKFKIWPKNIILPQMGIKSQSFCMKLIHCVVKSLYFEIKTLSLIYTHTSQSLTTDYSMRDRTPEEQTKPRDLARGLYLQVMFRSHYPPFYIQCPSVCCCMLLCQIWNSFLQNWLNCGWNRDGSLAIKRPNNEANEGPSVYWKLWAHIWLWMS